MKIAVFGGTGSMGQSFVAQALNAGHSIQVLARIPQKMKQEQKVSKPSQEKKEGKEIKVSKGKKEHKESKVAVILADSDKISFLGQNMFFIGQTELILGIYF